MAVGSAEERFMSSLSANSQWQSQSSLEVCILAVSGKTGPGYIKLVQFLNLSLE